jgi:hypothetical protein
MGHIQKRADRRYRARWLDPDGKERSKTFTKRSDAERHLATVEGAKLTGNLQGHRRRVRQAVGGDQAAPAEHR